MNGVYHMNMEIPSPIKTVKGLEENSHSEISMQGWRLLANSSSSRPWPLLCVIRNVSEAEMVAKQKLPCAKEDLRQEREM